jgi:hypothetical protein
MKWLTTNNGDGPFGTFFVGGPTSTAVTAIVRIDYTCVFINPIQAGLELSGSEEKVDESREDAPNNFEPVVVNWYVPGPQEGKPPLARPSLVRQTADVAHMPSRATASVDVPDKGSETPKSLQAGRR